MIEPLAVVGEVRVYVCDLLGSDGNVCAVKKKLHIANWQIAEGRKSQGGLALRTRGLQRVNNKIAGIKAGTETAGASGTDVVVFLNLIRFRRREVTSACVVGRAAEDVVVVVNWLGGRIVSYYCFVP